MLQAVNIEPQPIHTRNGERKLRNFFFNSPKNSDRQAVGLWSENVQEAALQSLSKIVQIPLLELKTCMPNHFAN